VKKHAPATLRNREAIVAVLREELPERGTVLEIASGSGEHAVFFAGHFTDHLWLPSDVDAEALASIRAYAAEYEGTNLLEPVVLDAQAPGAWRVPEEIAAILCINMVHISPWAATEGLFAGAAQMLGGRNLPLVLYGPYFEQGVEPAPSNIAFDESLRSRNGQWGIRNVGDVDALAQRHGFTRSARHAMPANNLTLVYRAA
jgi:hypothetical protein